MKLLTSKNSFQILSHICPSVIGVFRPLLVCLVGTVVAWTFTSSVAQAQTTSTWNTTNGNWLTGTSWVGGSAPTSGSATVLEFGSQAVGAYTGTNNNPSAFDLNGLVFTGTSTQNLVGGTLNFVAFGASQPSISFLDSGGAYGFINNAMTVGTGINLQISGTSTTGNSWLGVISGAGSITLNSSVSYIFNNLNTFSGGLTSNTLSQVVISNSAATLGSGTITLNSSVFRGSNGLTGGYTTPNALVLNGTNTFGNAFNTGGNNLQFTGTTTLGGNSIAGISLSGTSASNNVATFSGVIGDGGANLGLTILGTGVLTLSGSQANTYTGTTLLNSAAATLYLNKNSGVAAVSGSALTLTSGTVKFGQSNQLTSTAQVTVNGGVFDLAGNNQQSGPLVGSGGVVTSSSGAAVLTLGESSSTSYSGTITGGGLALVKNGTGILTLSGSNSYGGTTAISAGGMEFQNQNSLYGNNTASWTAANLNVGSGATVTFGVGGTNQFTSANLDTLLALGTGSNGFQAGANIGLDVTSSTTFTYASNLANPNSGANTLGLVKSGAGTLVLSGSNSYSGGTTLGLGTLNYTNLNALGSGALTFSGNSTLLAGVSGTLAQNIVINPGATASFDMTSADITLTGTISGAGALNKSGIALNGNLTLSASNSYTGGTVITGQGNINLGTNGALGYGTLALSGGRLQLNGYSQTITGLSAGSGGVIQNQNAIGSGTGVLTVAIASGTNSSNSALIFRDQSGGASGQLALIKTGAGTLDFSLWSQMNYSGGLTVNAGVFAFNNAAAIGTGSVILGGGTLAVTSGSSVTLARPTTLAASTTSAIDPGSGSVTYSGILSGSGALLKVGTGTLTLSGSNTYSGGTLISNGQIALGSASALQNSIWDTTGATGGVGLNAASVTAPIFGGLTGNVNLATAITGYSGLTALSLNLQTGVSSTYSGVIAEGATGMALNMTGSGTQFLTGSNSYTGTTSVTAGILNIQNSSALGTGTAAVNSGAALQLQSGSGITVGNVLNLAGWGITNDGALRNISGSNTHTGPVNLMVDARINTDAGTLYLTSGSFALGNYALTVGGSGNTVIGSVLSGSGGLTKDGRGSLTLTASNSYLGNTLLSTGTLSIGDGTAGHDGSISSSSGINFATPSASLIYNLSSTASQTYSNGISGLGSLTLSGSASLTLTGNNSYTGATTINAGTLTIGGAGSLGSGTYSAAILNNGAFVYNSSTSQTLSGNLTGTGSLTKAGAGTLTLSSSNSYSGGTTLGSGTLNYANINALGSGALTFSGSATLLAGVTGTLAQNVTINPGATALFDMTSADITLTGTISGSGAFGKSGGALSGNLNLTSSNSYTGGTLINGQGNLNLYVSGALGTGTLTFSGNAGRLVLNGYSQTITGLSIGSGGAIIQNEAAIGSGTGVLTVALASGTNSLTANSYFRDGTSGFLGLVKTGAGTLDFSLYTTMSYSGGLAVNGGAFAFNNVAALGTGSLTLGGGTLAVTSGSSVTIAKNATLTASTTSGIDPGSGTVTYSGTLSGAGSIAKSGVGTLTLNRTNTYNGSTAVHAGTLVVSGSLSATSSVSIDSGAMLSVDGKVNSAITSAGTVQGQGNVNTLDISTNGTLAPGLSTANGNNGTLTAAGNVVFVGGSTAHLSIRLGQTTALGTDTLALASGAYSVNLNGADLNLTLGGSFGTPPLNSVYVIIDGNSSSLSQGAVISGFFAQNSTITVGNNTFSILYNENSAGTGAGKDVVLQLTAVPEPSAWTLMIGGVGMFLCFQRFRLKQKWEC